jgi:hypothetical protein
MGLALIANIILQKLFSRKNSPAYLGSESSGEEKTFQKFIKVSMKLILSFIIND